MYSFASYSPGKQTTISKSQQEQEKAEADLQRCEILQLSYKIHYFQRSKDYWENICREQNILKWHAAAAAKLLQLCPTLCDPIDHSPPGSPVPGILKARTLEWVAISFSNAWKWRVKVKWLGRLILSDPMDCSPPGSCVHGIFQARVLEWGAVAFSKYTLRKP